MTNRERIMVEMAGMSDRDMSVMLMNDDGETLTDRLCHACIELHGGECPVEIDADCLLWDGSWLRDEWDGVPLLEIGA